MHAGGGAALKTPMVFNIPRWVRTSCGATRLLRAPSSASLRAASHCKLISVHSVVTFAFSSCLSKPTNPNSPYSDFRIFLQYITTCMTPACPLGFTALGPCQGLHILNTCNFNNTLLKCKVSMERRGGFRNSSLS